MRPRPPSAESSNMNRQHNCRQQCNRQRQKLSGHTRKPDTHGVYILFGVVLRYQLLHCLKAPIRKTSLVRTIYIRSTCFFHLPNENRFISKLSLYLLLYLQHDTCRSTCSQHQSMPWHRCGVDVACWRGCWMSIQQTVLSFFLKL